jgi:hypothetical protein
MPYTDAPKLDIPADAWEDIYLDVDGSAPRLRATIVLVGGTDLYFTAICVEMKDGYPQEAINSEDDEDLGRLFLIEGKDGPFDTVTIGGAGDGREYVVFAVSR